MRPNIGHLLTAAAAGLENSNERQEDIMKKLITSIAIVGALALTGCGGTATAPTGAVETKTAEVAPKPTEVAPKAADLTGIWKQSNSASKDAYQQATITADTITIEWVTDGGDTTSVYWVGTLTAPTSANEPYKWSSTRDAAATDNAILASTDDTKEFTYEAGTISYKLSALGTTTTAKLKKN